MKQFILIIAILFSSLVGSSQKPIVPEQERLQVFVGRWTVEGSESTYLEICDRIQGYHIQCNSASKEQNRTDSSVSYLTYSPADRSYFYYGLYPSGNSRMLKGKWETDRFIFEGKRSLPEKTTNWKVTIKPTGKDLHFVEEASVNDGGWEKKADFYYRRVM